MPAPPRYQKPSGNRLDTLPNEILDSVMGFLPGVAALPSLVRADAQAEALFTRHPHKILLSAIECSGIHHHFRYVLCTITSIRQYWKHQTNNTKDSSRRGSGAAIDDLTDTENTSSGQPNRDVDRLYHEPVEAGSERDNANKTDNVGAFETYLKARLEDRSTEINLDLRLSSPSEAMEVLEDAV